ncbi:nuclear transport factor 2 family protein [Streptomyces sp. NPDC006430]|uniref:nuclear transport factor 2 family protein n=1 Tax=Streptomyces sp. NPDC006430 TaxID=3154299 RepID=UPI0033B79156
MSTNILNTPSADFQSLGVRLFEQWTALWNGDLALADRIVAPGFRVSFANAAESAATDDLRGPDDLARFVAAHRESIPGLHYSLSGTPVVDAVTGQIAARWTVTFPDASGSTVGKSGIDILAVTDGRITEVWSVTGLRAFASAG